MRLYLDEDIASAELIARLEDAGYEVLRPLRGDRDDRCWRYAQKQAAVVVTMNAVDFAALAQSSPTHTGLLLVYRQNDPTVDMTMAAVAAAIGRVARLCPDGVDGQVLTLNHFRW